MIFDGRVQSVEESVQRGGKADDRVEGKEGSVLRGLLSFLSMTKGTD